MNNKDMEDPLNEMDSILRESCKTLMFDELELVHWAKFIDRFDFKKESFALEIFFVGLATKLLLNDQPIKEPIEVYLSLFNN